MQPPRFVLIKRCSENMQKIYKKIPIPKCDCNKVAKQLYWNRTSAWCSPVNLLYVFGTPFPKKTSWWQILTINSLNANFTKWSNTLKQFVGNLPTNCLSVLDHFVGLPLKGLKQLLKVSLSDSILRNICLENFLQIIIKVSVTEFIFSKFPCFW